MAAPRSPDAEDLLARLVAIDSSSRRSNGPIADLVSEALDRPGVAVERHPAGDGKVNLLISVGPECRENREGLVLSGHLDTVPPGEGGWGSDPFHLTDRGDRWVGRGTCDMKGFLALAVALAAGLEPGRLRAPLFLLLTCDEELGSLGAQRFVGGWPAGRFLPRSAVVGEPTSLRAVRMHKGHLRLRLTLRGRAAHSAFPRQGENAIEAAGEAIRALAELRRQLESERPPSASFFPEAPFVALNVGRVEGGGALNVIPDRCTVDLGLRPLPGTQGEGLARRVETAVAAALAPGSWALDILNDSPPMLLDEGSEIHRVLCRLLGQEGTASAPFSSDAGTLQRLGLECALFGPGSITAAHRPNEHLPKAEFRRAGEILEGLVAHFCSPA